MHFAFYDPSFPLWRNIIGIIAGVFLVPVVMVIKLVRMPFERLTKRSVSEVADYLRDFINDTGGEWDFDDFISCEIENPALDDLRQQATRLQLPIKDDELELWAKLLKEAEALAINEKANASA